MQRTRTESGAVTAEAAVVLPVVVVFAIGLVWLIAVGATQVRALDAARETARAAARGDSTPASVGLGSRVATGGATFSVQEQGDTILVTVDAPVRGPGGLFAFMPTYHVHARAVAAQEPGS